MEEIERKAEVEKDDEEEEEGGEPATKKVKLDDRVPSAKVVGIVKRNWRQYCGMVLQPAVQGAPFKWSHWVEKTKEEGDRNKTMVQNK